MPAAFNRKVTDEADDLELRVLAGDLPEGLAGHVFLQSLALGPTDAGFSGDPLIWRLDLDGATPRITSRLLRSTDYLLGQAFADTPYRFESRGVMRIGPLGMQGPAQHRRGSHGWQPAVRDRRRWPPLGVRPGHARSCVAPSADSMRTARWAHPLR
ncbi:MAG: hypothetical protein M5U19_17865 [Microthrixaceae bacterium]|nr:hypothetical protein [Microthrixaceae bacterium]